MGWSGDTYNGKRCWFITLVPPELIMTICAIGIIPIVEVAVLYSIILYKAIGKVVQLKSANKQAQNNENDLRIFRGKRAMNENEAESQPKETNIFNRYFKKPKEPGEPSKSKAVKVVLFTTGSFIITWVPYFVASFLYVFCDKNTTPGKCDTLRDLIASPLAILGFCNSLLNPIIYAWWHRGFRDFVKKMITKTKQKITRSNNSGVNFKLESTSSSKKTTSTVDTVDHNAEPAMVSIDLNAN